MARRRAGSSSGDTWAKFSAGFVWRNLCSPSRGLYWARPVTRARTLPFWHVIEDHYTAKGYGNPPEMVKPFSIEERELSWLTDGEVDRLREAIRSGCENSHVEPIVLICLATGARWSEAEGLTPSRLRDSSVTFAKTKSSKVRTVPIDPALETFIRQHWKRHGHFTGAITSFRRALDRSGIELPKGQASHALRHTFASRFMQKGGNILTLQKILGHSSLAMTMRYAHLAPEHLVEAVRLNPLAGKAIFGQNDSQKEKAPEIL